MSARCDIKRAHRLLGIILNDVVGPGDDGDPARQARALVEQSSDVEGLCTLLTSALRTAQREVGTELLSPPYDPDSVRRDLGMLR